MGECRCKAGATEIGGTCVRVWVLIVAIVLPLLFILFVAVFYIIQRSPPPAPLRWQRCLWARSAARRRRLARWRGKARTGAQWAMGGKREVRRKR